MKSTNVAETAKALRGSGIPATLEPDQARLLIEVLRLVADGRPVSPEQIERVASRLHMPLDAATSVLSKISERDAGGNIVGIMGLSQKTHPHRFEVRGHPLATWCAWDTLFLSPLLKEAATVQSSCPATKERIRVRITPEKVDHLEPPTAVVSIVVPEVTKEGLESVEDVWTIFCHFVHFFTSREAASEWFRGKDQEPIVLSVDEAYQLGRLAFEDILKYA